ncbi:MAG: Rieske 2Fe-2S domain-containing protein [Acidimicrobiales bacterium]|jgi:phenylpropionate dioxygenase-like ring-hydroxylating dioxygenase large terminal subunit|nr:Rieske 2Fe-2S domain-containing protein [Acidimicrobiales bacterium]
MGPPEVVGTLATLGATGREGARRAMDTTLEATIRDRIEGEKVRTAPPPDAIAIPPIPTGRYTDPAFHELERERVFGRSWLFAGHESEWPEAGAYRLTTRSGAPIVVVRGDDGVLRAFYNSCRHRGAPVTRDECGTARRLTCQYHSWSYGTDGTLKAVPDARSFPGLDTASLGLVSVRCETWDGWVFVNEDLDAVALLEFLGPIADQMSEIDGRAMRAVGTQLHHLDCNWKLMVDAFLEVYHVRTVHPDNAALLYNDQSVTVSMLPNGHSRLNVEKHEMFRDMPMVSEEHDNPAVPLLWRQTSTSFGIFPNLVVPMDTGAFTFLCMWPTGDTTTELELRWYAPAWAGDDVPQEHLDRMELFETVMAQDKANMAPIQASVSSPGARPFQLGWHERLIHHFERAVDLAIGPDDLPPGTAVSDALDGFVEPR